MADLDKVQPGAGLRIPAADYNAMIETARAYQAGRFGGGGAREVSLPRDAAIVKVKNSSGSDRQRFEVLAVSSPIVTPTGGLGEFKRQIALDATTPGAADAGLWVVLLEPLAAGKIGRAVAAGVVQVRIDVTEATEGTGQAECDAGSYNLVLSATGSAKVLSIEEGAGEKWAVVRLGAAPAASSTGSDETGVAFPQTGRDYITMPSGGAYTYGRFRDASGIADDTFHPACETVDAIRQTTSLTVNLVENAYYLLPFVAQRSTIQRLAIPAGRANNGAVRLAIYEDSYTQSGGGLHYPTDLVYETSDLTWYEGDPQATLDYMGMNITPVISVSVTARRMYWMAFCYEYTTTYGNFFVVGASGLRATLGYAHRAQSGGYPQSHLISLVGLYYAAGGVTEPALSCPDPFPGSPSSPASGLTYIVGEPVADGVAVPTGPLVMVGYGA